MPMYRILYRIVQGDSRREGEFTIDAVDPRGVEKAARHKAWQDGLMNYPPEFRIRQIIEVEPDEGKRE